VTGGYIREVAYYAAKGEFYLATYHIDDPTLEGHVRCDEAPLERDQTGGDG
jgi:hypothetical protein